MESETIPAAYHLDHWWGKVHWPTLDVIDSYSVNSLELAMTNLKMPSDNMVKILDSNIKKLFTLRVLTEYNPTQKQTSAMPLKNQSSTIPLKK